MGWGVRVRGGRVGLQHAMRIDVSRPAAVHQLTFADSASMPESALLFSVVASICGVFLSDVSVSSPTV